MADLMVQSQAIDDEVEFAAADAAGDAFVNTGVERVEFVTAGGSVTVTFTGRAWTEHPDQPTVNRTLTLPGLSRVRALALPPRFFNDVYGKIRMTYSGDVGNLAVAVISAPNPR